MRARSRAAAAALLVAGFGAGCRRELPPADVGFVARWTATHYALARAERLSPVVAARVSAYASIALYEGWAAFSDSLVSLAGQLNGLDSLPRPPADGQYDPATVAVEAQTTVLLDLYHDGFASTGVAIRALHDSLIGARRSQGISEAVVQRSAAYGGQLGKALLAWAATDGYLATRDKPFQLRKGADAWIPTATEAEYRAQNLSAERDVVLLGRPTGATGVGELGDRTYTVNRPKPMGTTLVPGINVTKPVEPYWGELRTFALLSADSCQATPPMPYSSARGSDFYRQVDTVYQIGKTLTDEQRAIAYFWADNPGESGTPSGHWLGIISQLAEQRRLTPERAAEVYALSAIAMADAFIVCWRLKYSISLLRPVTFIQRHIDPKWHPLLLTPPFPEFASGHAIQSAATAEVLSAFLGDSTSFEDATHVPLGHPPRTLASFRAAAAEVGMSRVYGGIHYPMSNWLGQEQGRCVGRSVLERVRTRKER
ncbi:MAG: vanadium-dependent haloperoxidase [Gemmatimonadales bacterium]|nr:vanadium-dependent haloperoxidase [Gemmatimonadales bacterium]